MAKVLARAYRSPTLILLAMDWPDGESRPDFLGLEIRRTPGFLDFDTNTVAPSSLLPNRVSFTGPPAEGQPDFPSSVAPIQKFMWWDARLDGSQAGNELTYEITPVCGTPGALQRIAADTTALTVALPAHVEMGIGTWFNRAVMSSQAFSRKLRSFNVPPGPLTPAQALDLRQWLANGMETPVPDFVGPNAPAFDSVVGAIYHLEVRSSEFEFQARSSAACFGRLEPQTKPEPRREVVGRAVGARRHGRAAIANHHVAEVDSRYRSPGRIELDNATKIERELCAVLGTGEEHQRAHGADAVDALIGEVREARTDLSEQTESIAAEADLDTRQHVGSATMVRDPYGWRIG